MSDHDRCGCDESAALRRELEAGTPAMYRARLRDAERARDELAAEVERLTADALQSDAAHACARLCAARVRAEVLREAVDDEDIGAEWPGACDRLRAMADEAERGS